MDQTTKSLYCSLYDFLEKSNLNASRKSFSKETKFDVSSLEDTSIVKVCLRKLFEDHLASRKKEVVEEESCDDSDSDSSSSSDSDAESEPSDIASSTSKSGLERKGEINSTDSDSSDSALESKAAISAALQKNATSSSSSETESSDSESDQELENGSSNNVSKNIDAESSSSSDSDSETDDERSSPKKSNSSTESSTVSSSDSDSESDNAGSGGEKRKANLVTSPGERCLSPSKKLKSDNDRCTDDVYKIYIKGLPWTSSDDEVRSFFNDCGNVTAVELPLAEGGRSSGTAFVTFDSKESLDLALAKDEAIWPGSSRWLKISEAKKFDESRFGPPTERPVGCDTVFVGNLPWDIEESQLMDIFSPCGEVLQIRFAMGEDGSFRGFAHVRFATEESTDAAVALYGTYLNGRAIRIDYAPPRNRDSLGGGRGGGRGGFGGKGGSGRGRGKGGKSGSKGGNLYSGKKAIISSIQGTKTTFDE